MTNKAICSKTVESSSLWKPELSHRDNYLRESYRCTVDSKEEINLGWIKPLRCCYYGKNYPVLAHILPDVKQKIQTDQTLKTLRDLPSFCFYWSELF